MAKFSSIAERKKVLLSVFDKFRGLGDASVQQGVHVVFVEAERRTYRLEDMDDASLRAFAVRFGVLREGQGT